LANGVEKGEKNLNQHPGRECLPKNSGAHKTEPRGERNKQFESDGNVCANKYSNYKKNKKNPRGVKVKGDQIRRGQGAKSGGRGLVVRQVSQRKGTGEGQR